MIKAVVQYDSDGKFLDLEISGHGLAENGYGHDIYCAGVSSCIIGALNALDHAEHYQIHIESGHVTIHRVVKNEMHDEIVLETLIIQLGTIAKSYPNYVELVSRKKDRK